MNLYKHSFLVGSYSTVAFTIGVNLHSDTDDSFYHESTRLNICSTEQTDFLWSFNLSASVYHKEAKFLKKTICKKTNAFSQSHQ